jgi:16S rRNA (guanine527-N7)-methyltransferase
MAFSKRNRFDRPAPAGASHGHSGAFGSAGSARTVVRKPARVAGWTEAQWLAALPEVLEPLNLALTDAQQQKLAAYMVLLSHWNATFNLTALRDPQDMLSHHLADCLAVLTPLARHLGERAASEGRARLLDVGSGGGLPGVVLAIALPDVDVTCVDTVGKKAAFIRQVAAELRLPNLRSEHTRVEQLKGQYELITSRAFASTLDFVTLTRELLVPQGIWMAMKGRQPDEELEALPPNIDVFHVEQLQVPQMDAQRCIVWMRQLLTPPQG